MTGWWLYTHPSEKYEFVNWDDEIPNIWENKKWQPNHQPDIYGEWVMVFKTKMEMGATKAHMQKTVDGCEILHHPGWLKPYK